MSNIILNNQKVVDFYRKNPTLNINDVNLWIVELFEKMLGNTTRVTADSLLTKMQKHFDESNKNIEKLNTQLTTSNATRNFLEQSIKRIDNDFIKMKEDIKSMIVSQLVESQNNSKKVIEEILRNKNGESPQTKEIIIKSIYDGLNGTLNKFFQNIQQPITNIVNNSEKRITDNLERIKNENKEIKLDTKKTREDMEGYLLKYGRSKDKGNIGERKLAAIINLLHPTAEFFDTTFSGGGKGDFIMKRQHKPQILFETKEYSDGSKVPKKDVVKFINDVKENNCSGILVNHTGAITEKENFYFEFNCGHILLYIHNGAYDTEKIDTAIRIIDYLNDRLSDVNKTKTAGNIITDDNMEQMNIEFIQFNDYKNIILTDLRNYYNNTKKNLETMQFSTLQRFLGTKYATEKLLDYFCPACDLGFKNNRALAAHKKSKNCKMNQINTNNKNNDGNIGNINNNDLVQIKINTALSNSEKNKEQK